MNATNMTVEIGKAAVNSAVQQGGHIGQIITLAIVPWVLMFIGLFLVVKFLPWAQRILMTVSPTGIDYVLLTSTAGFIFSQTYFSSEDSYRYVNAFFLYWLKYGFGVLASMALALKAARYKTEPASQPKAP